LINEAAFTDATLGETDIDPRNPRLSARRPAVEISKLHASSLVSMLQVYHPARAKYLEEKCVMDDQMTQFLSEAAQEELLQARFGVPLEIAATVLEIQAAHAQFERFRAETITRRQLRAFMFDAFGILSRSAEEKMELTELIYEEADYGFVEAVTMAVRVRTRLQEFQEQSLHEKFDQLDEDSSGALSIGEVETLFEEMGMISFTDRSEEARAERERVRALIKQMDADGSGEIEFNEFAQIVVRAREMQLERLLREQNRIVEAENIPPAILAKFPPQSGDILEIWRHYDRYFHTTEENVLVSKDWVRRSCQGLFAALCDLGLPFSAKRQQHAVWPLIWERLQFSELDDPRQTYVINFAVFLHLLIDVREYLAKCYHEDLYEIFKKFDRDGNEELSLAEVSRLLGYFDCLPRTVAEQKQIVCLLDDVDEDGSGTIDFEEFKALILKIKERKALQQRAAEREHASSLNIGDLELHRHRESFAEVVTGYETQTIGYEGVVKLLQRFGLRSVTMVELMEIVADVDEDQSGCIDFMEYLTLMHRMLSSNTNSNINMGLMEEKRRSTEAGSPSSRENDDNSAFVDNNTASVSFRLPKGGPTGHGKANHSVEDASISVGSPSPVATVFKMMSLHGADDDSDDGNSCQNRELAREDPGCSGEKN